MTWGGGENMLPKIIVTSYMEGLSQFLKYGKTFKSDRNKNDRQWRIEFDGAGKWMVGYFYISVQ